MGSYRWNKRTLHPIKTWMRCISLCLVCVPPKIRDARQPIGKEGQESRTRKRLQGNREEGYLPNLGASRHRTSLCHSAYSLEYEGHRSPTVNRADCTPLHSISPHHLGELRNSAKAWHRQFRHPNRKEAHTLDRHAHEWTAGSRWMFVDLHRLTPADCSSTYATFQPAHVSRRLQDCTLNADASYLLTFKLRLLQLSKMQTSSPNSTRIQPPTPKDPRQILSRATRGAGILPMSTGSETVQRWVRKHALQPTRGMPSVG